MKVRGSDMRNNTDRHLDRVIHRTICIAKLAGENYTIQNELAVRTVRRMKPDMTASEALAAVDLARRDEIEAA